MPSLDELEAGLAVITVRYKTIDVTFEYHPDRVGMNLQRAIAAVSRPPHDVGPICDELARVLSQWDLTRGGEPIPITTAGIGSLGVGLAGAIGSAIMEDFTDPKSPRPTASELASSTSSPPGSRPASSGSAPTGDTSSASPDGPASIQPSSPGYLTPVAS